MKTRLRGFWRVSVDRCWSLERNERVSMSCVSFDLKRHRPRLLLLLPSLPFLSLPVFDGMSWPSSSSASTSSRTSFPPLSPTSSNGAGLNSSASSSLLLPSAASSSNSSSPETISRRRSVKSPHPLSSINTRADSDQDDATRPKLTRRTTETREELERVGRSSESSDGGLRQSLELLRKGKANIDGGVDVLVYEVSSDLLYGFVRETGREES